MLDIRNHTGGENARPHQRTALIAIELERFGVDIAALSETRISGEGSLTEVGGATLFGGGTLKDNLGNMGWASQFAQSSWIRSSRRPPASAKD